MMIALLLSALRWWQWSLRHRTCPFAMIPMRVTVSFIVRDWKKSLICLSGLIHSDQLTAIESESKHDLLSDMRGSETAPASQSHGWSPSRWSTCALLVGMAAVGLYADFGASWVASKR